MRWNSSDIEEIRTEAHDALSDAFSWQLAEARWQAIYQILAAMAAAVESGDADALAAATIHLELAGPLRIIPIDRPTGPTPAVRDLLNKLVHALGGVTAGQPPQPPQPPQAPGDTGVVDADVPRG